MEDDMFKKVTAVGGATVAMVSLTLGVGQAQTTIPAEHFSFVVSTYKLPSSVTPGRLDLTINRWSNAAERDQLLSEIAERGIGSLPEAAARFSDAGYMYWPGGLEYIVRYAQRTPRPDGGEDVLLVTERPIELWWETSAPSTPLTVVELRLGKDGKGEGQLFAATGVKPSNKVLATSSTGNPPAIIADLRRESNKLGSN
jgi:hypothetical protein